ncbi:phosphodiester glycosidase family protein [Candidatus Uhrbacteria bacterium]|nr:phosphodiester glycosidase family protein [Candidatus Uhrbacteria bacterium]
MKFLLFPLLTLTLLFSGCGSVSQEIVLPQMPVQPPIEEPMVPSNAWIAVDGYLERLGYVDPAAATVRAVVYRWPLAQAELRLVQDAPHTIREWKTIHPEGFLVINGVYFHDDMLPSGYAAVRGTRIGDRMFDLDKSAAVLLSPTLRLTKMDSEGELKDPLDIFQTFPWLVYDRAPAVAEDSGLRARRTFLGTDGTYAYVGVVSDSPLTLFALSHLLPKMGVDWTEVVNLDGGPSTGLSVQTGSFEETIDSLTAVPNVLMASWKGQ